MSAALADRVARAGLDWIVPRWPAPPNVRALVTTRNGGVSRGPYATMNLGHASREGRPGDAPEVVAENRARLRAFLPADPVWLAQVHGTAVASLDDATAASRPLADASVTAAAHVVCAVLVADCLPVLLADRAGSVVGIAHAGWRGLAAGVLEATLACMRVRATDVVAWLGPSIGPRAFEVGADVRAAFCDANAGDASAFVPAAPGKWLADLPALASARLARDGVRHVAGGHWCTVGEPARFFSYRRDRETGRMAATIWLEPAARL